MVWLRPRPRINAARGYAVCGALARCPQPLVALRAPFASPLIHQRKGGERMSDYEMIMIQLTILSLVVGLLLALIKKDK